MPNGIKVGLGLSYFDAAHEIPRALDPVYKHVEKIYAIDGRYVNYEVDHDYSIDGSTELLKKRYPNVVIEECKPMFQTDKRQRYFDLAGEDKMDYVIVWDVDDIVHPDYQNWNKFYRNLKAYAKKYPTYHIFQMRSWLPEGWARAYNDIEFNKWRPYIRIHRDPANMRYCLYCHFWFAPKDATDEDLILQKKGLFIADQTIDGVRLTTDSKLRGKEQLKTRDNWAWNNICEEQRRLYEKNKSVNYGTPLNMGGYWRYDSLGRPTTKICNEDGTKV